MCNGVSCFTTRFTLETSVSMKPNFTVQLFLMFVSLTPLSAKKVMSWCVLMLVMLRTFPSIACDRSAVSCKPEKLTSFLSGRGHNVQTLSFHLKAFTSKLDEGFTSFSSLTCATHFLEGPKVIGQLIDRLLHVQVWVITLLRHYQLSS